MVDSIAIEPGQRSYESTVQGLVSSHPQVILTETDRDDVGDRPQAGQPRRGQYPR